MAKTKVIVVEDEGLIAEDIKRSMQELGYSVPAVVSSGTEALKKVEEHKPDLVLMDIVLQGEMDGIEAAKQIGSRFNIPVVYLTAYADIKTLERAKITDPFGYIIKPFEDRELHTTVEMALHKHKLERRLKESEEWLSTTLKSIGDAVIATDTKSTVTFMNPVAESLTGWREEDAKGKPLEKVFKIINEKTRVPAENPVSLVIQEGIIVGLANHTVLTSKDGTETPIDDSAAPIRDEEGNIIGVVLVFRDVTDRRRAEERIEHNYNIQSTISSILQISLEPISLQEQLERTLDLILSIPWLAFQSKGCIFLVEEDPEVLAMKVHQGLSEALQTACAKVPFGRCLCGCAASTGETVFSDCIDERHEIRYPGIPPHGHYCVPIKSGDRLFGVINMYVKEGHKREKKEEEFLSSVANTLAGIIVRKQAEEALRESEEKYRHLFEDSIEGISISKGDRVISANKALLDIFGYRSLEEFAKVSILGHVAPESMEMAKERMKKREKGESPHPRGEYKIVRKDGKIRDIEVSTAEVLIGNEKYVQTTLRDITDRKRLEEELKDHVKELEQSNRLKDIFTDILRHDLLNPIGVIQNAVEMIRMDREHTSEVVSDLNMIQRNVNKLQVMIDNATKYAKLESVDKLDFEKADLSEIIGKTIKRVEDLAKEKDMEIVNKIKGKHFASTNPFIEDVFINVITNALKYGPEKSRVIVDIGVNKRDWRITVTDFGEGIPDEYKETVFRRFERITKGGVKGTGLGLTIARRIVELHNGKIWVEDNPNGGSIFCVNIPKA